MSFLFARASTAVCIASRISGGISGQDNGSLYFHGQRHRGRSNACLVLARVILMSLGCGTRCARKSRNISESTVFALPSVSNDTFEAKHSPKIVRLLLVSSSLCVFGFFYSWRVRNVAAELLVVSPASAKAVVGKRVDFDV